MYTPKGAGADQYTYTDDVKLNSNLTRYDLAATLDSNVTIAGTSLNLEKAAKTGYYVAQSKTANRTNTSVGDIYDWFVVQYDKSDDKWYYNRITSTTVSVEFFKDEAVAYDASSSAQYNDVAKKFTTTIVADEPIDTLYYYESQYAARYESVINFADNLKSTGVDHRISIVGFSSPYYDGIKAYNGSGVYVGGDYYLYDTDYKYKGFLFGGNYVLYAPRDGDVYQSMGAGILPDSLVGTTWLDYVPQGVTEEDWVILDVSEAFEASYFGYSSHGKNVLRPAGSLADYVAGCVSDSVYQQALVSVKSEDVIASIEAITTNFQQTCPAVGLEMAKNILNNRADTSRDEIVILFTDGVPTVGMYSDNEDATSQNATTKETHWSGLAGAAQAINLAYGMKQDAQNPVQIYTIGTSGLASAVPNAYGVRADSTTSITGEEFLDCVSSNYANATAEHVVTPGQYTDSVKSSVLTVTNGTAARTIDYSKTSSDGSVSVAFNQIMTDVSSASVTLDADAVLKEYLSDYFDLDLVDASEIKLYVAPYKVTITATYGSFFDHKQENGAYSSYDFYLDAIRIYNPANDGLTQDGTDENGTPVYDSTIQDIYQADGEGWPSYEELRNLLIDKDSFDALGSNGTVNGMVFIDGIPVLNGGTADNDAEMPKDENGTVIVKKAEIATYMNYGPNNELYLAPGQGVAFTLQAGTMVMDEFGNEVLDNGNIASIQLALKTVGGSALVQIGYYEDGSIVWLDTIGGADGKRIETATDMYYDITALNGKTIIIKNGGVAGVLSITNIKTTHWADSTQMVFSLFGGRTQNITFMLAALNAHEDAPEQNVPGTDGEQSPETGDTNIELLALVTLTACVIMLAVLILPSVHKRIVK
jgi:hypothetical protein